MDVGGAPLLAPPAQAQQAKAEEEEKRAPFLPRPRRRRLRRRRRGPTLTKRGAGKQNREKGSTDGALCYAAAML